MCSLNTWRGLCETNPQFSVPYSHNIPENFPAIYIRESSHLWLYFVPGFSGCGFTISTNSPGACSAHWGWQQLFSYSSCAAKGHEHERGARGVPLPLCDKGMDFFLICRCPNFPKIRTKMESTSSGKRLLASWLLKTLLSWVQFGKLFGNFQWTFPN